ncbi:MAG: hypothetical protein HY599_03490 [Candidatus Omnitrophica bacterium]|nr:hypothetical protein [Candidatus Omnitrophota bacterium]
MSPHRPLVRLAMVGACCVLAAGAVSAMQRTLKSKIHNYKNAPIDTKRSQAALVETYTAPTQVMVGDSKARTSRVRYANRAGLAPSVFVVSGEALCTNVSPHHIEAFSLAIVVFDAFHQPVQGGGQGPFLVQQVVERLPRGASKRVTWEQPVGSADVYEVAVIVTRVRFEDGTIWTAPNEELLDIF